MIREALEDAVTHHRAGRFEQASRLYKKVLRIDPNHPDALHLLGVIDHQRGRHRQAAERIRRAISVNPDAPSYYSNLGAVYRALGESDEAVVNFRHAVRISPDYAEAHGNLGNTLAGAGRYEEAVASFRQALRIRPDHADLLSGLANALRNLGEPDEAETCCRRALEIHPDCPKVLNNLGNVLSDQGNIEEAEAYYRKVLQLQPDHSDALANLASWLEQDGRIEDAKRHAAKCLRTTPDHPQASLALAKCEAREGRYPQAIERLTRARRSSKADTEVFKDVTFQLGRLYDRVGDVAEAFGWFAEGNRLAMLELGEDAAAKKAEYFRTIAVFRGAFTRAWIDSWSPAPPPGGGQAPVFLVGFPRSGTTLMDVILDSHPRIRTLEERPTVSRMGRSIECAPSELAPSVARLTPAMIESLRSTYFDEVDRFVDDRRGKVLIDKLPLNIIRLGFILRVFPTAKVIVAVRHPCDVCLSCFMQNFKLNAAMANMQALEDTAALYDGVMRLWRQYVEVLPHAHQLVRYEDLVEDFEGQTRRSLRFLELDWDDAVGHYADHARQNRWINTPSYHQVVEPIYRRACGRWRRYARQLAPVMDVLRPHIEYFGYDS